MRTEELEAEALKLDRKARARLVTRLLESLEVATEQENLALWAEEAEWRDREWDRNGRDAISAEQAFREVRESLK